VTSLKLCFHILKLLKIKEIVDLKYKMIIILVLNHKNLRILYYSKYLMSYESMVCQNQKLDRDPSLEQIPNGRHGVVLDGVNLPSSITEDIRGLSLCVSYSAKQLRRIEQIAKKNAGRERMYSMSLRCHNKNFRALMSIKPSVGVRLTTDQRRRESEDYIQEAEI
jgi:hypothetical protein